MARYFPRKLLIRLIVAAVALVGVGILVFLMSRKAPAPDAPDLPTQATADTTEPTLPPTTVIHYAAAGDLNVNELTVNAGGSGYLYTDTFLDVAHLLGKADVSSLNFEGNL